MGFKGEIQMEGHVGIFCLDPDSPTDERQLAPESLPIDECAFNPTTEYALSLSDRLAEGLREFAISIPHGPGIVLTTVAYGKERPLKDYPEAGRAKEWNESARYNNGITIRLIEATTPRITR
jgi:hypothetical protein